MIGGIDIGGTKVLGIAFDGDSQASSNQITLPTIHDSAGLIDTIIAMVPDLEAESGCAMEALGVGVAGIVDRDGTLRYSPNIPGVVDLRMREILSDRLSLPVVVENDATTATWAECRLGAGTGSDNVIFVGLGTGIGSGFVLDGVLHRGWNGFSGETGHITIDKDGAEHITGARGPWELTASGNGLVRLSRKFAEEGRLASVLALAGSVDEIGGRHIEEAVRAGARDACDLLDEFAIDVGVGLASLIHVLDPEVIIIGGGLVELGPPLLDPIRRHTAERVLGGERRPTVAILPAQLGNRSGAMGAALLAADLIADRPRNP